MEYNHDCFYLRHYVDMRPNAPLHCAPVYFCKYLDKDPKNLDEEPCVNCKNCKVCITNEQILNIASCASARIEDGLDDMTMDKLCNKITMKLIYGRMSAEKSTITAESLSTLEDVNIYNLFVNDEEYPDDNDMVNSVPIGTNWTYVSTTYLNGFINYVNIIGGYMIRRYKSLEEECDSKEDLEESWESACKNVDNLKNNFHTNTEDSSNFDDILVLAKSNDSFWLFWSDCDCSDSCIGRLPIKIFENDKTALEYLHKSVRSIINASIDANPDTYMKFMSSDCFSGWKTL